jgi:hypothetical protein
MRQCTLCAGKDIFLGHTCLVIADGIQHHVTVCLVYYSESINSGEAFHAYIFIVRYVAWHFLLPSTAFHCERYSHKKYALQILSSILYMH